MQEKKLTMVSSVHGTVLAPVRMAAPHVDDELAVDVDGDARAEFLALADLVGERDGQLVEFLVPATLQHFMHRTIMRRRDCAQIAIPSKFAISPQSRLFQLRLAASCASCTREVSPSLV